MSLLMIEHSDQAGSDRFGETLRDYGHRLRVVRVHRGEPLPPDLDDVDGIVSLGGPQSPEDDAQSWMEHEFALMRAAHEAEMPLVGICLGSQLLARALGGTTAKLAEGIEFGFHEVTLTPAGREDAVLTGIAWRSMQFEHHRYEVKELPPDARLLATSARCRVQVWAAGVRTYGLQYHPEMYRARIDEWLDDEPELLSECGVSSEIFRRQVEEHWEPFQRLSQRLFESLSLFVLPVDRRYQGVTRDLHH